MQSIQRLTSRVQLRFKLQRRWVSDYTTTHHDKNVLILGSSGALGSTIVSHLKQHYGCTIIGADIAAAEDSLSLDAFLPLSPNDTASALHAGLKSLDKGTGNLKLNAIICANGGFLEDDDKNPASGHARMMEMNYYPVVAASSLLSQYITKEQGLFCAVGATSALAPSPPYQTAYGASKVAVHHLLHSIGVMTKLGLGGSRSIKKSNEAIQRIKSNEYLDTLTVVGILPGVLDTDSNRNNISEKDSKLWTKPIDLAVEIGRWVFRPEFRPHSGALVKALTKRVKDGDGANYKTVFNLVR